jgi:O-antigen ligase
MGNLLLAPALLAVKELIDKNNSKRFLALATFFAFGVFLTFSRGAIYAYIIGLILLAVFRIFVEKKKGAIVILPVTIFAFLFALNAQGMMSAFSGLGETYNSGIEKVVNHLSLGVIKMKSDKPAEEGEKKETETENKPAFDGYVAESTDTRVRLTNSAISIWSKDFNTLAFGVGVGGAGQALYNNDLSPAPKEIIQNEYASVLLETGAVGFVLFVFTIGLAYVVIWKKNENKFVVVLITTYLATLFFFSGYPNALHIYLLPVMLGVCFNKKRLR